MICSVTWSKSGCATCSEASIESRSGLQFQRAQNPYTPVQANVPSVCGLPTALARGSRGSVYKRPTLRVVLVVSVDLDGEVASCDVATGAAEQESWSSIDAGNSAPVGASVYG